MPFGVRVAGATWIILVAAVTILLSPSSSLRGVDNSWAVENSGHVIVYNMTKSVRPSPFGLGLSASAAWSNIVQSAEFHGAVFPLKPSRTFIVSDNDELWKSSWESKASNNTVAIAYPDVVVGIVDTNSVYIGITFYGDVIRSKTPLQVARKPELQTNAPPAAGGAR